MDPRSISVIVRKFLEACQSPLCLHELMVYARTQANATGSGTGCNPDYFADESYCSFEVYRYKSKKNREVFEKNMDLIFYFRGVVL